MGNKIAVMASGNGSNFEAIALQTDVELLICNKKQVYALERAKKLGVKSYVTSDEKEMVKILKENKIEWIFLAGYMKIISPVLLDEYEGRIVNIHPSLLPKYPGLHSIERAYKNKEQEIGITIHYVDKGMDTGKQILQDSFKVDYSKSLEEIESEVHKLEHKNYPKVVEKLVNI